MFGYDLGLMSGAIPYLRDDLLISNFEVGSGLVQALSLSSTSEEINMPEHAKSSGAVTVSVNSQ